jgi:hypothetical protein
LRAVKESMLCRSTSSSGRDSRGTVQLLSRSAAESAECIERSMKLTFDNAGTLLLLLLAAVTEHSPSTSIGWSIQLHRFCSAVCCVHQGLSQPNMCRSSAQMFRDISLIPCVPTTLLAIQLCPTMIRL